jgi:hypothetical protein
MQPHLVLQQEQAKRARLPGHAYHADRLPLQGFSPSRLGSRSQVWLFWFSTAASTERHLLSSRLLPAAWAPNASRRQIDGRCCRAVSSVVAAPWPPTVVLPGFACLLACESRATRTSSLSLPHVLTNNCR